jgi:dimethylargininase
MGSTHLLPAFTHILARRPAPNFADGLTTSTHLGTPDLSRAMQQYETYLASLRSCGLHVTLLDADDRFPDGHFVEDPVVIFRDIAFLCHSGAPSRRGEAERLLPALSNLRIVPIEQADAFIDGGDVLFCRDRVLVGLSDRTNQAGIDALRRALQSVQPDIRVDAVPFRGLLHLKSGLTELAPGVLIRDPALLTDYPLDWAEVITLPAEEGYAADTMPINDTLFLAAGFPQALEAAKRHYQKIVTLDMSEFQKMDGGLTCLSLRFS